MDCAGNEGDTQKCSTVSNTQLDEDCNMEIAQKENQGIDVSSKISTLNEEDCPTKEKITRNLSSSDSINDNKSAYSSDISLSISTLLCCDDSTPDLLGCSPLKEEVRASDNKDENDLSENATPNLSPKMPCSKDNVGETFQTLGVEFSNSVESSADPADTAAQSSTPISASLTKSRNIGCQSTPSGPEDSQEKAPQLSISTPDLFLRTAKKSNGTPLSRGNASLSVDDLSTSKTGLPVSSSLDINDEHSTDRLISDHSFSQATVQGSDDNFKIPHQMRLPEKRRKSDLGEDSASDLSSAPKKACLNGRADSRRSITIVKEIRKSPPLPASQDVQLEYIASQPDSELALSSDSIVHLDEEDEIMEVPAEPAELKEKVVEITLDGSNHTQSPSPGKSQIDDVSAALQNTSLVETVPVSPANGSGKQTVDVVGRLLITQRYSVEYHLKTDSKSGKIVDCNIIEFEACDTLIKEEPKRAPRRRRSADSSGVLADESSPPSPPRANRDSLSSTVSGPGLFKLQPSALQRMSMFSTTSSSSTGSANNKGLPLEYAVVKSNKWDQPNGVPIANWNPGSGMEESLKAKLTSFFQTEISANLDSETRRNGGNAKEFISEEDVDADPCETSDNKRNTEPLRPVMEESTCIEKKGRKSKKNVTSPRSSRRTPSQRLETRKIATTKTGQEMPKSERKRRGRPPASPALKESLKGTPKTPSAFSATTESPSTPLTPGMSAFQPGVKVFAMWTDRKFYPAELIERVRDGQWRVFFLADKIQKVLPERSVLLFNTFECDQEVLTLIPNDNFYKSGIITDVIAFENKEDLYTVKLDDDGCVQVTWKELSLSEQHAQVLLDCQSEQKPSSARRLFTGLDLDNVVQGKRLRSSRCSTPVPSSSKSVKISTPGNTTLEEFEEPEACLNISGIEVESPNVDPLAWKGLKRGKGLKAKPRNPEEEKLLERLGPIPAPESNLFTGLTFFITSTTVRLQHEHKSVNADVSSTSLSDTDGYTDCECYVFSTLPMVKPRLAEQLTAGGGRVLKNVDQLEPDFDSKNVFVVTDRPCRTAVYVRCLALGIKSILHDWIVDCCKENKPLKIEQVSHLPVGYSNVQRRFIQWSEIKDCKPFFNKGILVQSQNRSFVNFWEKVVHNAGAKIITSTDLAYATVIVGEHPLPEFLRVKAEAAGIPVVSANWVTQSFINGEALTAEATQEYSLQYSESE